MVVECGSMGCNAFTHTHAWQVRIHGVHGVCRVLHIYWEIIPLAMTKVNTEPCHDRNAFPPPPCLAGAHRAAGE